MTLTLYGIPTCDTVRKTRRWLDEHGVPYTFHDFRADGIDARLLEGWIAEAGWEQVINRRSTSWKALEPAERETMDAKGALRAAQAAPTLVKRPVLTGPGILEFGFAADRYAALLT